MYPSQVWRLVCYPGSPAVPRCSGTIPRTVCSCRLCEHRGEKNRVAGVVQFPLAGWPLQGYHWSEGKVLRGAENLLFHSSSRKIQAAGADTFHRVMWFHEGAGHRWSVTHQHLFHTAEEEGVLIETENASVLYSVSIQTSASQMERKHCIIALTAWREVEAVCSLADADFWESHLDTRLSGRAKLRHSGNGKTRAACCKSYVFFLKNVFSQ